MLQFGGLADQVSLGAVEHQSSGEFIAGFAIPAEMQEGQSELRPHASFGPPVPIGLGGRDAKLVRSYPRLEIVAIAEESPHGLTQLPGLLMQFLLVGGTDSG